MKKLFFLVLLLSNFIGQAQQYTLIPDVNFEKALISKGIDSGAIDGKVLTSSVKGLNGLDVTNKNISDLTGIQDFVSLYTLICSDNKLININLTKNTVLNGLICSNNHLSNLNISENTGLESLSVTNNQLTDLDISKNNKLKSLFCFDNKLTKLDVSKNYFLENLLCYSNKITNLDVSINIVLKNLSCGINELTSLDTSKNTSLNVLTCFKNKISYLDVSKNTALTYLDCTSNQIANVDVTKNLILQYLQCYNNPITKLELLNNIDLTIIECQSTSLTSLNLKNGNNTKLTKINFTNNPNLKCIQVDSKAYSDANWSTKKDATASFSDNCNKTTAPIIPPVITATGNQIYCGASLKIIPSVSITFDPLQPDTEAVYVQISSGYVFGSDVLTLANPATHQNKNIVPSWDAAAGKLKLSSPTGSNVPYSDFEAALKDVIFSNNQTVPSGTRSFSITIGSANYLPSTQHYYQFIPSLGISWTDAKSAAESSSYFGLKGYLATILAADEAQLTGKQSSGAGWIGGSDAQTEGVWKWVTGPEGLLSGGNGVVFWNGGVGGTTPNFAFWNSGEPNQYLGADEDYAHITAPGVGITGAWNDLTITGDQSGSYQPKGYIVEYGGMPGDPILQISASTSITIPSKIDFQPASRCFAGSLTLQPINFTGNIRWYNAQVAGTILTIANTYSPNISTTTSYWVDTTNGACPLSTSNPRIEVVAKIISPAIISTPTPLPICENTTANLNATASSGSVINWYSSATSGTSLQTGTSFTTRSLTTNTSFYVDATESTCVSARTPIMATVLTVPIISSTTPGTRCDTGSVTLGATASAGTLNWYDSTNGGVSLGTGSSFSTPNISITKTYYVDVTESGCKSARTAVIASVYPINSNTEEVILCQNKTTTLGASIPGLDYVWSPGGETTQSITVSSIGNYEVAISSPIASSCGSKKIFTVIEHPKPVIKELIINDNTVTILLTDPKEYYEFSIDGVLFQKSNQFSYIPSGLQKAFVRENNECNIVTQDFTIFTIVKYFTPNNDGINDTWLIPEMKDYPGSNVKIFDRYGKLLKQLNAGTIGWNGQFNTLDLPADDYWYVLKLETNQPEIRGHFTLKR